MSEEFVDDEKLKEDEEMDYEGLSAANILRLIDWLEQHGHTAEQTLDCVKYVCGSKA